MTDDGREHAIDGGGPIGDLRLLCPALLDDGEPAVLVALEDADARVQALPLVDAGLAVQGVELRERLRLLARERGEGAGLSPVRPVQPGRVVHQHLPA